MHDLCAVVDEVIREQAVASLPRPSLTFPEVLEVLHTTRYTGQTVLHWHEGRVKGLDVPNPVRVTVVDA